MAEVKIEFRNVTKTFYPPGKGSESVIAVRDLSFKVQANEITCFIGPSGCGKSTILNLIAGFLEPTVGEVEFKGHPLSGIGPDRMMVFQSPVLFPWMTVMNNILLAGRGKGADAGRIREMADKTLADVGLDGFKQHYPYQLSGGMRQRLQIARALALQPEVLLLDEPFGALDAQTRFNMQELLQEIFIRYRPTVLLITHDIEEALFTADRVYCMSARPGTITEEIELPWERPRGISIFKDERFTGLKTRLLDTLYHASIQAGEKGRG